MVGAQPRCAHTGGGVAQGRCGGRRGCAWRVFRPILFGGSFAFDHAAEQIALGDDSNHAIPFDDRDAADAVAEQELRNRNNWLVGSNSDNGMSHKIAQGKICSAVIKIVFSHIVGMRRRDAIDIAFGDDPGQTTGAVQNRQATDTGLVH